MSIESVNVVELPGLSGSGSKKEARIGTRLDLIENLSVRISVIAGTAEVPAAQLFQMGPGDVLRLSETVDQPVDLVANGKLIARGVLVAAGDQLGVRVTEISPA
jgi:flagellar motor switch protein FliN